MGDAAAFKATYAGLRSLADGDFRISFDFPGHEMKAVLEVLTQGGMPSAAKGDWFAIARLNNTKDVGVSVAHRTTPGGCESSETFDNKSASGASSSEPHPARTLSNRIYLRLCNNPVGRRFLEEFCQDIVIGRDINNAEFAKEVVRTRLGIASLSEVDSDPIASEQAEQFLNLFAGWERGLETPRIQQKNQA